MIFSFRPFARIFQDIRKGVSPDYLQQTAVDISWRAWRGNCGLNIPGRFIM
jgi:hypothetical protein